MSITVNADVTLDDFPYKKYFSVSGYYYAIISKKELEQISQSGNFPPDNYFDYNTGMSTEATNNQDWWCVEREYQGEYSFEEAYLCTWYPTGWQLRNGWGSGQYLCLFPVIDELTTLPSDFPTLEFESLEEALSKTTSTTNSALTIQSNVGTSYSQYQAGQIDLVTLEAGLQSALDQLESLANASGNTLSDQVAVNNAITYTQTIQQITNTENIIETQTVSSDLAELISEWQGEINAYYERYTNANGSADILGRLEQSEAINKIKNVNNKIMNRISMGRYTSSADMEAINNILNYSNTVIESISNYKELDKSVSEKSQASDAEEIELLNEMVSVMQDQAVENKLQDQQIAGSAGNINSILDPVWNNKFFTYLIGTSGVLIIACILLHTRYRML